jgi:PAS domain S-box-containing protein
MSAADAPVKQAALTQTVDLDIEARLLREAYARKPLNLAMTALAAIFVSLLLWSHVDHGLLIVWLAVLLGATAFGYLEFKRFNRVQPAGTAVRKWRIIFMGQSVLSGAAWALGPTLMIWQGFDTQDALILGVLVCVGAVGMMSIAEQRAAMQGFICAVLVPPALAAFFAGGDVGHLVGLVLLGGAVALIWAGRVSADTIRTLLETQVQVRAVLDTALDAVVTMDEKGRITDWNQRAQLLFGWRKEEVEDEVLNELILRPMHGAVRESGLARVMKSAVAPSLNRRVEMLAKHRDGHEIPVEVATTELMLGGQTIMTAFITDISERRAVVDRLALFRKVFDASNQCVVISDASSRGVYQNRAHAVSMGYSDQEIIGKPFVQALPDESAQRLWNEVKAAIAETGAWEGQLPFRRKDGSQFMSVSNIGSIKDEYGDVQYVFNVFTDFTQELARRAELKLATDMAEHAQQAAEQANLAKSDFLSSMSHELRTPMNAILGFGQILEFDDNLTTDQKDSVGEILKGGRHLLKLINDVLDLAKIESSSVKLSMEAVSVADLIDESWRVLEPLAMTRRITLHKDLPASAAVTADRGRLKQVLLNLLSNAINFNREQGDIGIRAFATQPGLLRIEVTDSGSGIAPERLPNIFEAFNRRGTAHGQVGGTGIGLIITRRLVSLMGGEVGVESQLGMGTTFWIELPVAEAVRPSAMEIADDATAQFDSSVHHYCVLCIDDNPVNLKLIAQLLSRRPRIHLISAHTPGLGIQLALGRQPDLILLDINMPGMDGYQVMEVLKTYARTKSIPIIAVTANATPRDISLGGATGLADYLTKPLQVDHFLATVDRWLEKGRAKNDDWPNG